MFRKSSEWSRQEMMSVNWFQIDQLAECSPVSEYAVFTALRKHHLIWQTRCDKRWFYMHPKPPFFQPFQNIQSSFFSLLYLYNNNGKLKFQQVYFEILTKLFLSLCTTKRVCRDRLSKGAGLRLSESFCGCSEFHQTFLWENVPTVIFSLPHFHPMHTISAHSSSEGPFLLHDLY